MKQPKYQRVWIRIKKARPARWKRGWKALPTWRQHIKREMDWCLSNEPSIHYIQQRPFNPNVIRDHKLPMGVDCSASTTALYKAVGRPDPNGHDYDGTGFTGTLRTYTPSRTRLDQAQVGDFIIYGEGPGEHVVVVYRPGKNPQVFSHGQERGPWLTMHDEQIKAHGWFYTVHNGDLLK